MSNLRYLLSRHGAALVAGLLLVSCLWGAVEAAQGVSGESSTSWARHFVTHAGILALLLMRAWTQPKQRALWSCAAASAAAVAIGVALAPFGVAGASEISRLAFFATYPLYWLFLWAFLRQRVGQSSLTFLLDVVGSVLWVTAVLGMLFVPAIEASGEHHSLGAAWLVFSFAGDLAFAAVPLIIVSLSGRRAVLQDYLLSLAFLIGAVPDGAAMLGNANYIVATTAWLHVGWELSGIVLACAALAPLGPAGTIRVGGWWEAIPTVVWVAAGGSVLLVGQLHDQDAVVTALAVAVLAAAAARGVLAVRDVRALIVVRAQAFTDALTGLPNRHALTQELSLLTRGGVSRGEHASLLVLGFDGFQDLDDALGRESGDVLIRLVGTRLRDVIDADLYILDGDAFAVFARSAGRVDALVSTMREALRETLEVDGITVSLDGCVGIASFPEDAANGHELLRRAELAMRNARASGLASLAFQPDFDVEGRAQLELAAELRAALTEGGGGLWLAFQPQIDVDTGHCGGAEALIRWSRSGGDVSPAVLIPLAVRSGLMSQLTDWVLDRALEASSVLKADGRDVRMSVNVSAVTLVDLGLPGRIAEALRRFGVDACQLVVEVTEDAIMSDHRRCREVLDAIASEGVQLSIDDFGTGQSSLAQLKSLPVGEVKIDRSFVGGMHSHDMDAAIVRMVIELCRNASIRVVAEGIENEEQHQTLRDLNCDVVQGFGIGRPMPFDDLREFLGIARSRPVRLRVIDPGSSAHVA